MKPPALVVLAVAACSSPATEPRVPPAPEEPGLPPMLSEIELPPVTASEPDGAGDGAPGVLPASLRALARGGQGSWVELGEVPGSAHPIVCDLIEHRGALYASHAVDVINRTGARIHRWSGRGWELAFDYNKSNGGWHGGGGQGLSRIRSIDGRLVAVDCDSTSAGFFGISQASVEAYLFVSDEAGRFDPVSARTPPARTVAIAGSLHSFDAIRYRGRLVVSGGSGIRSGARDGWPGALWAGEPGASILEPRFAVGHGQGVVRTTYLHRFGGRLYVGFQNNEARARFDVAVLSGDPLSERTEAPVKVRLTRDGGWLTRRFASGGGELYWIASGYNYARDRRPARLWRSENGRVFEAVDLPEAAGQPQDIIAGRDVRLLLTTTGLWAGVRGEPGWRRVAPAPPGDPFGRFSTFCSAPLATFGDTVVAGATRDGRVFRLRPGP